MSSLKIDTATLPDHDVMRDHTVDQINELTDRLEECLTDAARVRARLISAHDANQWPDVRGVVARLHHFQVFGG